MSDPVTGVGRPNTERGRKIINSPFKDEVATLLLLGKGLEESRRYLQGKGLKVSTMTVSKFRDFYVLPLEQQVKDRLIEAAKQKEQQQQSQVIQEAVHHQLSTVESTIELIKICETQMNRLTDKNTLSTFEQSSLGNFIDKIKFLRQYLYQLQTESELERTRDKVVNDITDIIFDLLRDQPPLAEKFIQKISEYRFKYGINQLPAVTSSQPE